MTIIIRLFFNFSSSLFSVSLMCVCFFLLLSIPMIILGVDLNIVRSIRLELVAFDKAFIDYSRHKANVVFVFWGRGEGDESTFHINFLVFHN